jgi:hypothetical protein
MTTMFAVAAAIVIAPDRVVGSIVIPIAAIKAIGVVE